LSGGSPGLSTYELKQSVHVILSIFSPATSIGALSITDNFSDVARGSISDSSVKFTFPDGTFQTIGFSPNYTSGFVKFHLPQGVKQGENKIEYDYEVAQ
jgi:hypothetical protein